MPREWHGAAVSGIPLTMLSTVGDTVSSNQFHASVDVGKAAGPSGPSARLLADAKLPVVLSVPLADHLEIWGRLFFARRADSAFTAAHRLVLEAAGYLLGALFAGDRASAGADCGRAHSPKNLREERTGGAINAAGPRVSEGCDRGLGVPRPPQPEKAGAGPFRSSDQH